MITMNTEYRNSFECMIGKNLSSDGVNVFIRTEGDDIALFLKKEQFLDIAGKINEFITRNRLAEMPDEQRSLNHEYEVKSE